MAGSWRHRLVRISAMRLQGVACAVALIAATLAGAWPAPEAATLRPQSFGRFAQEASPAARQVRVKKTAATPPVEVTIRSLADNVRFGDSIPVEFTIRNVGRKAYEYLDRDYDRSGRLWEYQLVVETEAGETLPDPKEMLIMGGLAVTKKLPSGGHFTKTVFLNQWAIIKVPGRYRVTGIYNPWKFTGKPAASIRSSLITINVHPRTDEGMRAYILELQRRLETAAKLEEKRAILERLAYTCSPEILPVLLKTWYEEDGGYWEVQALSFYVPRSDAMKRQIMEIAAQRGLANGMQSVLARYGITSQEMYPLIERSLTEDNPSAWAYGTLAAQVYANDAFTTRLIELATDPKSPARQQAIYALALNRTEESVRVLRELLHGPDEAIRKRAADSIRAAYLYRGVSQGRPLLKTDFDERLQRPE